MDTDIDSLEINSGQARREHIRNKVFQVSAAVLLTVSLGYFGLKDFLIDEYLNFRGRQVSIREIPAIGIFLPQFGDTTTIQNFESQVGSEMEIISWYEKFSQPISEKKLHAVCDTGHTPQITYEPWSGEGITDDSHSLEKIAAGNDDELLRTEFRKITQICPGQDVLIRFAHEMNTLPGRKLWYPWQGDPKNYIAAWTRVDEIANEINPDHLKMVWGPVNLNDRENYDGDSYWPGSEHVDRVALTLLNFWQANEKQGFNFNWRTFRELYRRQRRELLSYGKPVIISETATGEGPFLGSKAQWIDEMFSYIMRTPEIDGVVWFNNESAREHPDMKWKLESSQAAFNAFSKGIKRIRER
jgi:beta-mannanase